MKLILKFNDILGIKWAALPLFCIHIVHEHEDLFIWIRFGYMGVHFIYASSVVLKRGYESPHPPSYVYFVESKLIEMSK